MTGGTIGADTSSVYGGRAVAIFKDSDGSAGTFTLDGGTVRTYSNSSYNGRTVHLITGTFNYNSGTVSATTSYTDTYQLWRQNGTTFNNPANISLKTLNY